MNKKPNDIKAAILSAGVEIWNSGGRSAVTHRAIALKVRRSPGAVLYHFNYKMEELRDAVASHAVKVQSVSVILQLLASKDKAVATLSDAEKSLYLAKR